MSLQKFKAFIGKAGLESAIQIVEFTEGHHCCKTAADAANKLSCDTCQIVNSLIFKSVPSGIPVLILTAGHHKVQEKSIGPSHFDGTLLSGEQGITRADAIFVRDRTGFPVGGVPPFGHDVPIATLIDSFIVEHKEMIFWAAAGTPNTVFSISSPKLLEITKAKVISI